MYHETFLIKQGNKNKEDTERKTVSIYYQKMKRVSIYTNS